MGLERVAAILQGKHDNYDIDIFRALILASAEITGQDPDGPFKTSHRVIADHLRSTSFLMADGVLPSNEGRGYVLRRIMRRAMRHATMMGAKEPLMHRLVPALIRQMGAAYPELGRAQTLIEETLLLEETRFKHLLERGLHLLAEETGRLGDKQALPGSVAFRLYDTYGFPLDLTQDALREQGRGVDLAGFEAAMQEQRTRARAAWAGSGDAATERVWFEIKEKTGASEFLGYATESAEGEILAIVVNGATADAAPAGTDVAIVLNQTPFYGESGGQVGDTGVISGPDGLVITVTDTQKKLGDLFVHLGRVEAGVAKPGIPVVAAVDHARRGAIRAHHSATHLLHEALRRKLGTHVQQKGSLNAPDRLRFDVSQPRPITADELHWVEAEVNANIRENSEVTTRLMTPDAAVELGAMALFGEKYGDEVRVVAMGEPDGNKPAWSIELCGGTHVRRTGDIGYFRIVGETAVAAGVRRIEAVTGAVGGNSDRRNPVSAERSGRRAAGRPRRGARPHRRAAGGSQEAAKPGGGTAEEARHRWRGRGGRGHQRGHALGPQPGRSPGEGPEGACGRDRQAAGVGRGGTGIHRRRQGQHRGRGIAGPDRPDQRGRSGARGLGGGRRQRRRRAAGSGSGRRPGWREGRRGAGGGARGPHG